MKHTRKTRRTTTNAYKTEYDAIKVPSYFYYDKMREERGTITRDNARKTKEEAVPFERSNTKSRFVRTSEGIVPP